MKKLRKTNLVINTKIMELQDVDKVCIFSTQNNDEKNFKAIKKVGDFVKRGEPIFENENGYKILSSVSGNIVNIGTHIDFFNNVIQKIEIENDKNYEDFCYPKHIVKNVQDFINLCKDFGLCNNKFFLAKYFENLQNNDEIIIDVSYDNYNTKNYQILVNFYDEIIKTLNYILSLFNIKKVKLFANKSNIDIFKQKFNNGYNFITKNHFKNTDLLTLDDLLNISFMLSEKPPVDINLCVSGCALKTYGIVKIPIGTNLQTVIDFCGGFKQNIEEIENFKYTAMLAFNDEIELKNKIKKCVNKIDKEKLKTLLFTKQKEAKENIYSKLGEYHKKYLDCLSACLINNVKDKIFITNFDNYLQNDVFSITFLTNKEFN